MFRVHLAGTDLVGVDVHVTPARAVHAVRGTIERLGFAGVDAQTFDALPTPTIALQATEIDVVLTAVDALRRNGVLEPSFVAHAFDDSQQPVLAPEEPELHREVWPLEVLGVSGDTYGLTIDPEGNPAWKRLSARDLAKVAADALARIGEPPEATARSGLMWLSVSSPRAADRLAVELGVPGYSDPYGWFGEPSRVRAAAVLAQNDDVETAPAVAPDSTMPSGFFVHLQLHHLALVPPGDEPVNGHDAADALRAKLARTAPGDDVVLDAEADGFAISAQHAATVTRALNLARDAGIVIPTHRPTPAPYADQT